MLSPTGQHRYSMDEALACVMACPGIYGYHAASAVGDLGVTLTRCRGLLVQLARPHTCCNAAAVLLCRFQACCSVMLAIVLSANSARLMKCVRSYAVLCMGLIDSSTALSQYRQTRPDHYILRSGCCATACAPAYLAMVGAGH